jgi:Flp pilus assembly secretin CpaC
MQFNDSRPIQYDDLGDAWGTTEMILKRTEQQEILNESSSDASYGRRTMFLLWMCVALAASGGRAEELTVGKGYSTNIAVADGIRKLVVASDSIIAAGPESDGKSAVVLGLAEGSTELRIQRLQGADLVYKVTVHSDLQGTNDQIKELLSDVPGLKIKCVGCKIVFEGMIKSQVDAEKIKKVEAAYPNAIIDLTSFVQPDMPEAVRTAILHDLHERGLDLVTVQLVGDTAILDGVVYSAADLGQAVDTAKLRAINVKSLIRVQEVMIETDLQFVEVDQDAISSLGENLFDNNIVLQPVASVGVGRPSLNLAATATYRINAALTAANCKSIYQEHISGASGQEVAFKQGRTMYVAGLPAVPYGVIIKVKPTLQGKDGVMADLTMEVSTATSGPGQVTTTEFRTGTSVMSKIGQTVVISGFAQALRSASDDKTPVLGDIPLLNFIFAGKSKSKSHKEAVLLLTTRPSFPEAATGPAFSAQSKSIINDAHAN